MTNIPTELLRTFVGVVDLLGVADLRGFTKAAQALGFTQPAVSAQIKRLQVLLGSELLDKSAHGVVPTERVSLTIVGRSASSGLAEPARSTIPQARCRLSPRTRIAC